LKDKSIAWLVSYEDSLFIPLTLEGKLVTRIITFLISLIFIYFVVMQVRTSYIIKQKHELLNDILDSTDNILFITNFKKVVFSNSRFKNLLNIKTTADFNENNEKSIISIFAKRDGYLHEGLLKDGESLISLLINTPEDKRVVSILDRHLNPKAFKIDITRTNHIVQGYLVTLSDITIMQAKQELTNKKAYIDSLTKVYNRNKFDEIMNDEFIRVKRFHHSFSMAILDIDKFKDFNDKYGHLIGDEVLIMMAQSVNGNIRKTDAFARWGGEEFVILFREISSDRAKIVSQKLKDEIEKLHHKVAGGITVSFGVTEYVDGDTIETLFKRCDDALYKAKENGRNRVEVLNSSE
ncbi:MAG: GGDEF domain-containing protein, partial [Sulfurimonas sp.]|nr:GGDEF domain-containing protein [Sulfurimonas sp.]